MWFLLNDPVHGAFLCFRTGKAVTIVAHVFNVDDVQPIMDALDSKAVIPYGFKK